ncbi:MAG: hypothetical protein ACQERR_07265 [Pseudomonadota bacterium]
MTGKILQFAATALMLTALAGCGSMNNGSGATESEDSHLNRAGFKTSVEDGRLWVLRPGEEKSEKHATLINAGPRGMTVKALDRETALEYLATKPGFEVSVEDERLWVLRPGEEKSEKHATLINAGPQGMTVKALEQETAQEYLATRPGFEVEVEDNRIWVLRPGEEKSEKHSTLIGAGPLGMTVKALDDETALAYLATRPGFDVRIEDGRIWALKPGDEKSEKHATRINAGVLNRTVKAVDAETIDAYLRTPVY